jgi:hypothetical protein
MLKYRHDYSDCLCLSSTAFLRKLLVKSLSTDLTDFNTQRKNDFINHSVKNLSTKDQ